jgi:hypothetical protein
MAALTKPSFRLDLQEPENRGDILVKGKISYTPLEQFYLSQGLVEYKLKCTIVGKDSPGFPLYDDDNDQFSLAPQSIKNAPVTDYTFVRNGVPYSSLDEDWATQDELYARVTLVRLDTGEEVSRKSNTVDADIDG